MDDKSWLNNFIKNFLKKFVDTNIEEDKMESNYAYNQAFEFTVNNEGGYSNHEKDLGKETYMGISRYYNPQWNGWEIIDNKKQSKTFPNNLRHAPGLIQSVKDYYKLYYWDAINGDDITNLPIAVKIFDMAVFLGVKKTVEYLQECLFVFNGDIKID